MKPVAAQGHGRDHIFQTARTLSGLWVLGGATAAVAIGAATSFLPLHITVLAASSLALAAVVLVHPPAAAYILLGATPLIAGIDRGAIIPILRPNEALGLLLGAALVVGGLLRLRTGGVPTLKVGVIDLSILAMAVASSIIPLLWMLIRGLPVAQEDLLYSLMLWKYFGVYLLVRMSIRTEQEVRRCLWVVMTAASIVAIIAIFQSLQLFGVPRLLSTYYVSFGNTGALDNNRGSATLSLPIAVADLMTFNLAIASAWWAKRSERRTWLVPLMVLFVFGILASGQFSAAIALVLAAAAITFILGRRGPLLALVPIGLVAGLTLRPVIQRRLTGFNSASGLPESWIGRLHNLRTYFWPDLFADYNFVLGIRPAARVATSSQITGYIWIESGYTWLLWSGGIPFLSTFLFFLVTNLRLMARVARQRADAIGIAGAGAFTALIVVGVLMSIDPHLTYRGSADLLFSLLALASKGIPRAQPQVEAPA